MDIQRSVELGHHLISIVNRRKYWLALIAIQRLLLLVLRSLSCSDS